MRLLFVERQKSPEILLIHDDRDCVVHAATGDAIAMLRQATFDVIILDLSALPEAAFRFIRQVRAMPNNTRLLGLTGRQADQRIRALRLGADDTVAQPIAPGELRACIDALTQRQKFSLLQAGSLTLLAETREVWFRELPVRVTAKEYLVLELLALRHGQFVTKQMLLDHIHTDMNEPQPQIVDVLLCRLRRKLGCVGAEDMIRTAWGQGYCLTRASGQITKFKPAARPRTRGNHPAPH